MWFLADNRSNWKNKNQKKLSDAFIIIIKIIFSVFWLLMNKWNIFLKLKKISDAFIVIKIFCMCFLAVNEQIKH